ncbi:MAG: hypothetical protein ACRDHF_09245 [Tepidiformaceae bacterium]
MVLRTQGGSAAFGPDPFETEFDRRTRVEIRVTGLIDRYYSNTPVWDDTRRGNLAYRYGPGGIMDAATFQCVGTVVVVFDAGFYLPCSRNGLVSDTQAAWADTVVVQGKGFVVRNAVPEPSATLRCGDPLFFVHPCFTYDGTQSVTVTPVANELIVEADSTQVHSGSRVAFSARRRDGRPLGVVAWRRSLCCCWRSPLQRSRVASGTTPSSATGVASHRRHSPRGTPTPTTTGRCPLLAHATRPGDPPLPHCGSRRWHVIARS